MFLRTYGNDSPSPRRAAPLRLEALDERAVPAVIAQNDAYTGIRGRVLTVDAVNGVLTNDFSDQTFGSVLAASQVSPIVSVGSSVPLPPNTLTLNANGSFTVVVPSNLAASVTALQFTYRATNLTDPFDPAGTAVVTIGVIGTRQELLAVGPQAGGLPIVNVYDTITGQFRGQFEAYEGGFTGGVRVATGDLNGDGIDDIAVAPGPGGGDRVKVFNGRDFSVMFDAGVLNAPTFRGGEYVAIGDIDGNGRNDLIVGAGEQGGPRVVAIDIGAFGPQIGAPFVVLADFFAYEPTFRDGVRVAAGDLDGIGRDFIVTTPGAGGGPVVKVFDYVEISGVLEGRAPNNSALRSFFAGDAADRRGLYVATGRLSGDGKYDIITSTGSGTSTVNVFDGTTTGLIRSFNVPIEEVPIGGGQFTGPNASYFNPLTQKPAGTLLAPVQVPSGLTSGSTLIPGSGLIAGIARGGVTVTAADWNGDGIEDIVVGSGPGNPSRVRVFSTNSNAEISSFLAFDSSFLGGVNVG